MTKMKTRKTRKVIFGFAVASLLLLACINITTPAAAQPFNGPVTHKDVKVIYVWVTSAPDKQLNRLINQLKHFYTVEVHNVSVPHSYWWNQAYLGYGAQKYPSITVVFVQYMPTPGYVDHFDIYDLSCWNVWYQIYTHSNVRQV